MTIRPRIAADDSAIRRLNDLAFGTEAEAKLVESLRDAGAAAIELVAVTGSVVTGHVLLSVLEVTVDGRPVKALALAPLSVRPDRQRTGIGSDLVHSGLDRACAEGWEALIVLGDPAYYARFGFSASLARHLEAPFSGEAFMALALRPGALSGRAGRVVYPAAFALVC